MRATLPLRIGSERGRTEYVLVSLVQREGGGLACYPISKGSGAVTTFGHADGFFAIGPQTEMLPEGAEVEVSIIGARHKVADLVIIGSHCAGLDVLIGKLIGEGLMVRALNLGSTGGLAAAKRGECDIAGIHLMDPVTGEYNRPFVTEGSGTDRRLRAAAGDCLPAGRCAIRGAHGGGGDCGRGGGFRMPDGEPQCGERHADRD